MKYLRGLGLHTANVNFNVFIMRNPSCPSLTRIWPIFNISINTREQRHDIVEIVDFTYDTFVLCKNVNWIFIQLLYVFYKRGSIVLRDSALHLPPNSFVIDRSVLSAGTQRRALPRYSGMKRRRNENIKYFISSSGNWTHNLSRHDWLRCNNVIYYNNNSCHRKVFYNDKILLFH